MLVQEQVVVLNHGDDAEVQAFIDAEDEALNEEERLLMGGPDFEDAIENAFQQGLEAGHAGVEMPHVSPLQEPSQTRSRRGLSKDCCQTHRSLVHHCQF